MEGGNLSPILFIKLECEKGAERKKKKKHLMIIHPGKNTICSLCESEWMEVVGSKKEVREN